MRRALVLGGLSGLVGSACSLFQPLPQVRDGWELGVRRGVRWSYVTVQPPYIIGPSCSLRLRRGLFYGHLAGHQLRIELQGDNASGAIGGLPVEIDFDRSSGELEASGLWSGASTMLRASQDHIRISVPLAGRAACCREYNLHRTRSDLAGFTVYTDDRDYGFITRLEFPDIMNRWYTSTEVAVIVLAVMSG